MNIRQLIGSLVIVAAAFSLASQANAGAIIAAADTNIGGNNTFFSNVFSGQDVYARKGGSKPWSVDNWSASAATAANSFASGATLTAGSISGVEWVIAGGNAAWTPAELTVLTTFANSGGNVWVVGEYGANHDDISVAGNSALAALGSSMSFSLGTNVNAFSNNIGVHPFTVGVASWTGGSSGEVFGGFALATNATGNVLVATESLTSAVPEPATLGLLGLGIAGLGLSRRRRIKA